MKFHLCDSREVPTIAATASHSEFASYERSPGYTRALAELEKRQNVRVSEQAGAVTMQFLLKRIGRRPASKINETLQPVADVIDWLATLSAPYGSNLREIRVVSEPCYYDGRLGLYGSLAMPSAPLRAVNDYATETMQSIAKQVSYDAGYGLPAAAVTPRNEHGGRLLKLFTHDPMRHSFELPCYEQTLYRENVRFSGKGLETPQQLLVGFAGILAVSLADETL